MNFIKLKNSEVYGSTCQYAYFDTKRNYADNIFIVHKIPVEFGKEFKHKETGYRMIFVTFEREYEQEFVKCMRELREKMISVGKKNYDTFCKNNLPKLGN